MIKTTYDRMKNYDPNYSYIIECRTPYAKDVGFVAKRVIRGLYLGTAMKQEQDPPFRNLLSKKKTIDGMRLLDWPFVDGPSSLKIERHGRYIHLVIKSIGHKEIYYLRTRDVEQVRAACKRITGVEVDMDIFIDFQGKHQDISGELSELIQDAGALAVKAMGNGEVVLKLVNVIAELESIYPLLELFLNSNKISNLENVSPQNIE